MPDSTIICRDTQFFSQFSPAVFQAVLDIIPSIGRVLNWEPLAIAFLTEVLRQLSLSGAPLILKHDDFARILWGDDISLIAARRRIGRAISALKRCQLLSGFQAVWVESGSRTEKEGVTEYTVTTYRLRDFIIILVDIQNLAKEQDLMALSQMERKRTQLAIAQNVCDARDYQAIPKRARQSQKKKSETKEKSPSLLCPNPCSHCAAKNATGSEANGARPAIERTSQVDVARQFEQIADLMFASGQNCANLGYSVSQWLEKLDSIRNESEFRLRDAIKRHNQPRVKLVGGQPK